MRAMANIAPGLGTALDAAEAATGKDLLDENGRPLTPSERAEQGIGAGVGAAGAAGSYLDDVAEKFRDLVRFCRPSKTVRPLDDLANAASDAANMVPPSGTTRVPRKPSSQIRKEWEEANKKPWPKDPATGQNQDVSHKTPLADGGTNALDNIEPMPHAPHVQQHMDAGDFRRWGARRRKP
jgi:hypothetical protein